VEVGVVTLGVKPLGEAIYEEDWRNVSRMAGGYLFFGGISRVRTTWRRLPDIAPQGVAGSGGGPLVAVGQGENVPRLVHLTNAAGRVGIETSGQIVGRHGIFAVPEAVAQESTAMKVLRTGLPPSRTAQAVPIPEAATQFFRRPVPIGLYSAWKYLGGTYYAAPGTINTATGAFTSGSWLIGPRLLIYGPDGAIYVVIAIGGGIYWYAASMENK
jgi:hypothetical protein